MVSNIVPNAEVGLAAGETADLMKDACRGDIKESDSSPVGTIAKVGIVKIDKIIGVHQSNSVEDLCLDQEAARGAVVDRTWRIKLSVIFSTVTEMSSRPTQATEVCPGAPNLARVIKEQNLWNYHFALILFLPFIQLGKKVGVKDGIVVDEQHRTAAALKSGTYSNVVPFGYADVDLATNQYNPWIPVGR